MRTLAKSRQLTNVRAMCADAKREAHQQQLARQSADTIDSAIAVFKRQLSSLRQRNGIFVGITEAKRDAVLCEAGFGRPLIVADICEMSDDALIELAGACASEIERRNMTVELSPELRRAVEQHVLDCDADQRFDAQFYASAY